MSPNWFKWFAQMHNQGMGRGLGCGFDFLFVCFKLGYLLSAAFKYKTNRLFFPFFLSFKAVKSYPLVQKKILIFCE